MLDKNISKLIKKDFQIGNDEIEYTEAKEQFRLNEFELEQIRHRELEFTLNSSIKAENYRKKGCIVEKLYSYIHSEEYKIYTYTVLIDDIERIIKLRNLSRKNMDKDIKKEYEEKIYNLKNMIKSLEKEKIALQNENTNLKSKLQEAQENSKSSHQPWKETIFACFQYAFEIARKGKKVPFTKTNIPENPNEKGIKIDILKEEIKSRMGGKKPTTTVVNLLKKAIPPHLRNSRGRSHKS